MGRFVSLAYGLFSYGVFFASFLYAIGFIGNVFVPTTLDGEATMSFGKALGVDLGLLMIFAVQHSVMARPAFKSWWTKIIPQQVERSTYVLASSLLMFLLFWAWQPLGTTIWDVRGSSLGTLAYVVMAVGWALLLYATFLLNHFDLFGLRQVVNHFRGRVNHPLEFVQPALYKRVRHPIYVGWLTAFWATPTMSVSHLVFASVCTVYILVAIQLEERDLIGFHPEYETYRKQVPMLIPRLRRRAPA